MQVVVKGRAGQFVMPVRFARHRRVDRCRRHRRRAQVQQPQPGFPRGAQVRPQAAQVVELVAAAGIGEGEGVEVVGGKKSPQGRGVRRAVLFIEAVFGQRVAVPHQGRPLRQFGVLIRLEHGRRDGAQVIQEVLFEPPAIQGGQAQDQRAGEILPHPAFQLQAVAPVGRKAFFTGFVGLVPAAAVGIDRDAGNEHHRPGGDAAQILPRGAHDGQVGLRVGVGQKHRRRDPCIHTEIGAGAVGLRHIAAVAGGGKGMACQQVAPHKAGGTHQKIVCHTPSLRFRIFIQDTL